MLVVNVWAVVCRGRYPVFVIVVLNGMCISPNSVAGCGGVFLGSSVSCVGGMSCPYGVWVGEFVLSVASDVVAVDD